MEAPVWRFALAPGLCGAAGVVGVMLPSVDRAGRYFPLTFATLPSPELSAGEPWDDEGDVADWLDRSEAAGLAALERMLGPEQVAALMPAPLRGAGETAEGSLWWTSGAPRVAATRLRLPALPDAADFAHMLSDAQPAEPSA
jgi:type VI secretion system protein ImpM